MPKETGEKLIASNKKARHEYHIIDTFEAGLVLTGSEVKSLRMGRASLVDGYGFIERGEAWLDTIYSEREYQHDHQADGRGRNQPAQTASPERDEIDAARGSHLVHE